MYRLRDIPIGGKFKYYNVIYVKLSDTRPYRNNVERVDNGFQTRLHASILVEKVWNQN